MLNDAGSQWLVVTKATHPNGAAPALDQRLVSRDFRVWPVGAGARSGIRPASH